MAAAQQEIGRAVPSFTLPLLGSRGSVSLETLLAGHKAALIIFWSGVCSHCRRYDQYFNALPSKHPDINFVAIASRRSEAVDAMRSAVTERDLTFPILIDANGVVAREYFAQQTPRSYLVGPGGALLYRGAIDNFKMPGDPEYLAYLEPALSCFLAGQPIARPETASFGCAIETVYYQIPGQL